MKKLGLILLAILFVCVGCETQGLRCAHLTNATQGLSTNYAIKMVLDEDERAKDKEVDLQIKSSHENQKILFGEEGEDKVELSFAKADEWYNLSYLMAQANGMKSEEYETYQNKGNKTYLFSSTSDTLLTFRVVVGEAVLSDAGTGQVLTSSEPVSDELEIEVKKNEE